MHVQSSFYHLIQWLICDKFKKKEFTVLYILILLIIIFHLNELRVSKYEWHPDTLNVFPCSLMEFAKSFIDIQCQGPSSHFPLHLICVLKYWIMWLLLVVLVLYLWRHIPVRFIDLRGMQEVSEGWWSCFFLLLCWMLPRHLLVEVLDYYVPVSSRSILCKHGHQPDTAVTRFLLSLDITFWLPGWYWLEIAVGGSLDKVTSCYSVM